jgi:hypothetical protein
MSKCVQRDSNCDSVATRMPFLGRRPIVARANYLNFCAAAAMTPRDSVSVAFGADCERSMAKLKMLESQ